MFKKISLFLALSFLMFQVNAQKANIQSAINYLKDNDRFDYYGICVYYVKESDEVWVENMDAKEEEE